MALFNFIERFQQPQPSQPEVRFTWYGAFEFKNFQLFSQDEIVKTLKSDKLLAEIKGKDRTEKTFQLTALLIKAFFDGMDQEYRQYEAKGLKFNRARFRLEFITDEENDRLSFDVRENLIHLAWTFVFHAMTNNPTADEMVDQIYRFRLWGGEEANHSVRSQFKKEKPNLKDFDDDIDHVVPDTEFRALQANIRQAKRDEMPTKIVTEMKDLLEKARLRRAILSQKKL